MILGSGSTPGQCILAVEAWATTHERAVGSFAGRKAHAGSTRDHEGVLDSVPPPPPRLRTLRCRIRSSFGRIGISVQGSLPQSSRGVSHLQGAASLFTPRNAEFRPFNSSPAPNAHYSPRDPEPKRKKLRATDRPMVASIATRPFFSSWTSAKQHRAEELRMWGKSSFLVRSPGDPPF